MRRIIIAATAAAALAGGAFTASAQQDDEKQRPQAQGQSKQSKQGPAAGEDRGSGEKQPKATVQGKHKGGERRAEPKTTGQGSDHVQSEKRSEPAGKSVEQRNQAPKSEDKSTAQDKSEAPKKGTAERKQDDDAQNKGTAGRKDEDSQKKGPAAAAKDSPDKRQQAQDSKGQRVELSQEQRTRVQTTIRQQNVKRVTNVNFAINIGTRIPRTVTLHALPRVVVEIAPYYRGYRYFVVEDHICIVDPATYEIVYVIDESGPPSHTAHLVLSSTQRQLILSNVDFGRPRANFSIRLALGAEIPSQVELVEFPNSIVATIPEIRSYRYVVVDRSVAIIDPDSRDVVLVIER